MIRSTLQANLSLASHNDGLRNCQPETGTSCSPAARRISAIETIKHAWKDIRRNTIAVILDPQLSDNSAQKDHCADFAPRRAVLQSVLEEVGAQQVELMGIGLNQCRSLG